MGKRGWRVKCAPKVPPPFVGGGSFGPLDRHFAHAKIARSAEVKRLLFQEIAFALSRNFRGLFEWAQPKSHCEGVGVSSSGAQPHVGFFLLFFRFGWLYASPEPPACGEHPEAANLLPLLLGGAGGIPLRFFSPATEGSRRSRRRIAPYQNSALEFWYNCLDGFYLKIAVTCSLILLVVAFAALCHAWRALIVLSQEGRDLLLG